MKQRLATLLQTGLILAGSGLAAWGVAIIPTAPDKTRAFWMIVLGALLNAAALYGVPPRLEALSPIQPSKPRRRVLGGALFFAALALSVAGSVILTLHWNMYFRVLVVWAVALPIAAMGLNIFQGFPALIPSNKGLGSDRRWTKWEIVIFILIIAVAAFLRCYRLGYFPPPNGIIAVEEPQTGLRAWRILEKEYIPWEFAEGNVLTVASFKLFGMNYAALRLPFVALSILTVAILYLLLRELVGRGARVAATVLFAFSAWHLTYSRSAHGVFTPVAFSVLFFYFLIRTRTAPKWSAFLWLGVVIVTLMLSYAPFRAAAVIAILFYLGIAVKFLIHRISQGGKPEDSDSGERGAAEAGTRRSCSAHPAGTLITVLVCFILFSPMWAQISRNPDYSYVEAFRRSSKFGPLAKKVTIDEQVDQYSRRTKEIWEIFHVTADSGTIGLSGRGKLDSVTGTMFVLALGYLLLAWRKGYNGFFLLVFMVTFHALGLLAASFDVLRLTGLVPLVYVLIGLWLGALEKWSSDRFGAWGRRSYALLAVAAVSTGAVWNWHLYFDGFIQDPEIRKGYVTFHSTMAGAVSELSPGSRAIAFSPRAGNVITVTSDSDWLVPKGIRGIGCENTDQLIDGLKKLTPGEEAILLIQRPVNLDGMERLLREMLGCGPFTRINHPDNPNVEISKVKFTVPQDPNSFEDFRERALELGNHP